MTGCTDVGPVDSPVECITPYSSDQVVAPFSASLANIDWRDKNVVTAIRNQGSCGSCYSFSTINAAETAYAIKTGKLYELSEQQIVDCDTYNYGCNGGWQMYASWYLARIGTILRTEYPYTGVEGTCVAESSSKIFFLTGYGYKSISKSRAAFKEALRKQVVNISFNVEGNDFY